MSELVTLPKGFNVYEATPTECLDILSESQILKHIPVKSVSELPDYIRTHKHLFYISGFRKYKMLFFFYEREYMKDVYDIHIACPRNSIVASRVLVTMAAKWILDTGTTGAKALVTSCPEGKIANMCRKLGGIELRRGEKNLYFMFSLSLVKDLV